MNKGEGKRKGTKKRKTQPNKKRSESLSASVSKEIVGLAMIGIGLLVMIGIFSTKAGLFGQFLKSVFVGGFGVGGYMIPVGAMVLGIFYMQGHMEKLFRLLVYGASLIVMLIVFFHLLSYGDDTTIPLSSLAYVKQASWQNGGYVGALIGHGLLKLIGIYGTYILLGVCYGIWMLLVTQFPIFSWIHEKAGDGVEYLKAQRAEAIRLKHLSNNESQKIPKFKDCQESIPQEVDGKFGDNYVGHLSKSQEHTVENQEMEIQFFDGSNYQEESSASETHANQYAKEAATTSMESSFDPAVEKAIERSNSKKMTHDEVVKEAVQISTGTNQQEIPVYHFPPVSLLKKVVMQQDKEASKKSLTNAHKLEETLASFGVEAKVTQIHRGPSVTRYELQPKQGVKVSKIVNLSDDIALNLAAPNIRIEAPIPGKAAVGIEVANSTSEIVYLRDVIDSDRFLAFPSKLAFALGKDIAGKPIIADIGKMPHILIAGAT